MAFNRCLLTAAACLLAYVNTRAQTIYYPAAQSQLLRSTAGDMAMLLQKAIAGSHFTVQEYNAMPASGIVLVYDDAITVNQTCKVKSNGSSYISFAAGQDNGLCYGIYEYLRQLGFRFYQPGSNWEIIPAIASPYRNIDTTYTCRFKYKSWFISGGCTAWAMDKDNSYWWDTYNGELGHSWALYQRRNNMVGGYRFAGHRDDIMTTDYINTLQNNPCYVAPYNGSRTATGQSVADVNSITAMQLWASAIENKYTGFRNTIFNNAAIYPNYVRNFNYDYGNMGIEVPDGAKWANTEAVDCGKGVYPIETGQHFALANFTAAKINTTYPSMRFHVYAYDSHAGIPDNVVINSNIDVQVVPTAFQLEASAKGILNRWYNKWPHVSEYHYLNLAQWSGETPAFFLDDLKQTIQRLKEKNSDGIVIEAAPSKFASLPFLFAANASLKNNVSIDSQLQEFCSLFGSASTTVYKLLNCWGDDKIVTVYNGLQDNKYKLPFYFQLVKQADAETQNDAAVIKQRIRELKAFLHYMVLHYNFVFDQRPAADKAVKAESLCLYLAKISRLQIVNSGVLINNIARQYKSTDAVYIKYNTTNGSAYQNGLLPLIANEEIDNFFNEDFTAQTSLINTYSFKDAAEIKAQFASNGMLPLEKINVQLSYTNGKDYSARSEFYLLSDRPGSFAIRYNPKFDMPGKGYINFTVEDANSALGIIKDFSISNNSGQGILSINIPQAGTYKLTITSKYKSSAAISIATNGNYFYKNGPFFGSSHENYRSDLLSFPGWFYVPQGINKIFFSINNARGSNGFAGAEEVSRAFVFKDANSNDAMPLLAALSDSALFYLQMPQGHTGLFYKALKMESARLCFANTSNIYWYARKTNCPDADFKITMNETIAGCTTQAKAKTIKADMQWDVYDSQQWQHYSNMQQISLPAGTSPSAIVTLKAGGNCSVTKRLGDDEEYLKQKASCAAAATPVSTDTKVVVYPNPGTGIFKCMQNGQPVVAEEVNVLNASGLRAAIFSNTQQFNISSLPAGMYFYTLTINKVVYKGKLVKM